MSVSADRNLLFGILALQMDFVAKDDLVAGLNAWVLAKNRAFADILVDRGCLRADHRALLDALVQDQLDRHNGDCRQSLAALSPLGSVRAELTHIIDTDLQASLSIVPADPADQTRDPTNTRALPVVGQSTSGGQRFRVLRPHAEGGLGRVSVAQDEELNREVALKEILSRYADDPGSRARFLLEAEVTGGLEHPGVVPVYGLGHYADGRPFYAMRFVRGESLKEAIERFHGEPGALATGAAAVQDNLRSLTHPARRFDSLEFRQLLGRFVDVCNAIAYAHSRRVLHRDLKPGNVVLGKYGETLVIDWGLAKTLDAQSAPPPEPLAEQPLKPASADGTDETLPGAAVGTPAFMSPEQAAGRWDVVGPASDIFSLGATLYAVLTGRPPFVGDELAEVLHRVERAIYPPPRTIISTVPAPLEAVCQKAMALNPADRYQSALALAADVEHWLADEPVTAAPEPWAARARRWGRRHRSIVTAAATLLMMAVVLFVGLFVQAERARTDLVAEQIRTAAERDRAVTARNQTRQALDAMLSEKSLGWLETQKELLPQQRTFLERVLGYYEQFAAEPGEDDLARRRLADAHFRVASLQSRLGRNSEAEATTRRCGKLVDRLVADAPENSDFRRDQARVHQNLGLYLATSDRRAEAEKEYRTALDELKRLAADLPKEAEYRLDEARVLNNLAVLLKDGGRRDDSETAFRQGLSVREKLAADFPAVADYRKEVARARTNLGALLTERNRLTEAEAEYRAAVPVFKELADRFPLEAEHRQDLAGAYHNLGYVLEDLDRKAEAETAYRSALALREQLVARSPGVLSNQRDLAHSYHTLGEFFRDQNRSAEAEAPYQAALAILEPLAAKNPDRPQYRQELADTNDSMGSLFAERGDRAKSEAALRRALTIREKLAAEAPDKPAYRQDVGRSCINFGTMYYDDGNATLALEWLDRAIATSEGVLKVLPDDPTTKQSLRRAHVGRGRALGKLDRHADAVNAWDRALQAGVGPASPSIRLERAIAIARAGDPAAAVAEADAVASGAAANVLVGVAQVHAVVAGCADSRVAGRSAARAVELLRLAMAGGFTDLATTLTDKDFDAVRGRADFVELVWDVADSPAAVPKP